MCHHSLLSLRRCGHAQDHCAGGHYHLTCVPVNTNRVAKEIASSITCDMRLQSYVTQGGPSWLKSLIHTEAAVNTRDGDAGSMTA
ncbi:hypothetical protein Bca101_039292 [Brassica carinata]